MGFVIRVLVNAAAIWLATRIVPGIAAESGGQILLAGLVLGLINALVRPVLLVLTLPLTLVTLGLFIFILNAICFALTAWLVPGFSVDGFWWALLGALLVSIVSWILNGLFVGKKERE